MLWFFFKSEWNSKKELFIRNGGEVTFRERWRYSIARSGPEQAVRAKNIMTGRNIST
jgi:hypothetical protein